jgi:hypothetical protein
LLLLVVLLLLLVLQFFGQEFPSLSALVAAPAIRHVVEERIPVDIVIRYATPIYYLLPPPQKKERDPASPPDPTPQPLLLMCWYTQM